MLMMKNCTMLIVFFVVGCSAGEKNPDDYDYCGISKKHICCKREPPFKNSISNCYAIMDDINKFRQDILHLHNTYRSYLAMGNTSVILYRGSNMNVLSYDLELEYLAWCNAAACQYSNDKIRTSQKFWSVGQNIGRHVYEPGDAIKDPLLLVTSWYEQYQKFTVPLLKKFRSRRDEDVTIGNMALLAFWCVTHVGCVRSRWDFLDNGKAKSSIYLVCNYGSTSQNCSMSLVGQEIYKEGAPCSDCRTLNVTNAITEFNGTRVEHRGERACVSKYRGLCGQIEKSSSLWRPPVVMHRSPGEEVVDRIEVLSYDKDSLNSAFRYHKSLGAVFLSCFLLGFPMKHF